MKKLLLLFFAMLFFASCKNDDDTIAVCNIPENILITNITFESATINWSNPNTEATFSIEYGILGFDLGTGTTVLSSELSINLSSLIANTTYDIYIKSICSTTNESMLTEVTSFTTLAPLVVPEFLPSLSQLNLFTGNLSDLNPTIYAFEYQLSSVLFTDYAHKQRLIALPIGESMQYVDNGFPDFPENTIIAKTFYYNEDERNLDLGRNLIETRVLIKKNDGWQLGNYKWNEDQTDALLDENSSTVPISFIDINGDTTNVNYSIPSNTDCFTCHNNAGNETPIGPKLRTLNFNNQLQDLIDNHYLEGINNATTVTTIPDYNDESESLENRARAYFDINCAHCHSPGGFCENQSTLRLSYETSYEDSQIYERRLQIDARMSIYIQGFTMPFIGTTMVHDQGYALIQEYLNSL